MITTATNLLIALSEATDVIAILTDLDAIFQNIRRVTSVR
jgi:hypothetical protein